MYCLTLFCIISFCNICSFATLVQWCIHQLFFHRVRSNAKCTNEKKPFSSLQTFHLWKSRNRISAKLSTVSDHLKILKVSAEINFILCQAGALQIANSNAWVSAKASDADWVGPDGLQSRLLHKRLQTAADRWLVQSNTGNHFSLAEAMHFYERRLAGFTHTQAR